MLDYKKPILDEDGNPIKILEVGHHFCIRICKRARAFKKVGYEIHGLGNKTSYGNGDFDTYSIWNNEKQLKNMVRLHINQGCRIITYSNEPDYPPIWIREVINEMGVQNKVKLVVDCHDLDSIRRAENVIPINERKMFLSADAIIYVSLPIKEITNKLHTPNVPTITLYSYCNEGVIDYDEKDIFKRKGLVYEGGINPVGDDVADMAFKYRSLAPIFKTLVEQGNEVHVYCGNMSAFQTMQYIGAVLYPPTDYDEMMKNLVKFKYGILIFNNENYTENQVNYTLTNKMHEYLHAGLPSLALWCPESEHYVKKHKIGFTFKDIKEIGDTSSFQNKYYEVMENIARKRKELVMENHIVKLENLYAELLGLERKAVPKKIQRLHKFEYGLEELRWVE